MIAVPLAESLTANPGQPKVSSSIFSRRWMLRQLRANSDTIHSVQAYPSQDRSCITAVIFEPVNFWFDHHQAVFCRSPNRDCENQEEEVFQGDEGQQIEDTADLRPPFVVGWSILPGKSLGRGR